MPIAGVGTSAIGIQSAGTAGNFTLLYNTIGSTSTANSIVAGISGTTTAVTTFQGISNAATGSIGIGNNTIQNCSSFTSGAGVWTGITSTGGTGDLSISSNNLIAGTLSGTG